MILFQSGWTDEQLEVTDETIVDMINNTQEYEDDETEAVSLMSHTGGNNVIEAAMGYVEHQPEASPTDILLFRR